jgi:hypothetical protein
MAQVNTELGVTPSSTLITLNQANVRSLAGVPTGTISMNNLRGKSNTFVATISTPQSNLDLYTYLTPLGYTAGGGATITIAPGVLITASTTATTALTIPASFGAGKLTLINNGFIYGKGGAGGAGAASPPSPAAASPVAFPGNAGGRAMSINVPMTLTNNSYIAGGGGGGGGAKNVQSSGGGGGGAGGGAGGVATGPAPGAVATGGAGGVTFPGTGGAGIGFPATPGATAGNPGPAGGGGGRGYVIVPVPPATQYRGGLGGGGGGWGAAGGGASTLFTSFPASLASSGTGGSANAAGSTGAFTGSPTAGQVSYPTVGGAGGVCIALNGNTITYPATGTRWGTIA